MLTDKPGSSPDNAPPAPPPHEHLLPDIVSIQKGHCCNNWQLSYPDKYYQCFDNLQSSLWIYAPGYARTQGFAGRQPGSSSKRMEGVHSAGRPQVLPQQGLGGVKMDAA